MGLSHLIYTVRPCVIHTCNALPMPCSDHFVLLKATAQHGRLSTAVLCCESDFNGTRCLTEGLWLRLLIYFTNSLIFIAAEDDVSQYNVPQVNEFRTIVKILAFFLSCSDLFLPTHGTCRGSLLHLVTLSDTNTHTRWDSSGRGVGPSPRPQPYNTQHSQEERSMSLAGIELTIPAS